VRHACGELVSSRARRFFQHVGNSASPPNASARPVFITNSVFNLFNALVRLAVAPHTEIAL
jgi:hypothetical protein